MKYFISTLNYGAKIDPIGMKPMFALQLLEISIVKETGESITLLSKEFNPSQVEGKYLQAVVESNRYTPIEKEDSLIKQVNLIQDLSGLSNFRIKNSIRDFIGISGELYGYMPFEDIVLLKYILGDLSGFYIRDIKQEDDYVSSLIGSDFWIGQDSEYPIPSWQKNLEKPYMPNSLEKCRWILQLHNFMEDFKKRNNIK